MTTKLFVYGTLMGKQKPTHYLRNYMMFAVAGKTFNFPVIQEMPDDWDARDVKVLGCILEVDDEALVQLDVYEGVARGLYKRVKLNVASIDSGVIETVQVYVGGPALVNEPIPDGNWNKEN